MTFWSSAHCAVYETLGADTATSLGAALTASASANTKGSWVDLGAVTTYDYHSIWVSMVGGATAADILIDIGLSDGANRWTIMPNLRCAMGAGIWRGAAAVQLPLHIPGGSQVSARCQASTGSSVVYVTVTGSTIGMHGGPGYSRGDQCYTVTTSRGVDIEPTTAHTKTAWTTLDASAGADSQALLVAVGPGAQVTRTVDRTYLLDIGINSAGSEFAVLPDLMVAQSATDDRPLPQYLGPFPVDIRDGARISARAQASDVTAGERKIDVAAWGFVR